MLAAAAAVGYALVWGFLAVAVLLVQLLLLLLLLVGDRKKGGKCG
jgi:hypothetical protein